MASWDDAPRQRSRRPRWPSWCSPLPPLSQYVSEVEFETSDEAYAQFQQQDAELSASVTPDQLPESF
ncbi:hypothetical protein HLB09_12035, partial [Pseudokineococcus marinus]